MFCLTYALTIKSVQWKGYIDIDIKILDDIYGRHLLQDGGAQYVFMANLGQNGINLITVSQMAAKFKQMFSDQCGFMN